MNKLLLFVSGLSIVLSACSNKENMADAYGNFEGIEQLVSVEASGKLKQFNVEEGQELESGVSVGMVDTMQLSLKKQQVYASIKAIRGKLQNIGPQVELIEKQIQVLKKEKTRVIDLIKVEAATQKQLDDIQGKLDVFNQQIKTSKAQNSLANRAILSQIAPLESQILQLNDQIERCFINNPISGTVLLKLVEKDEIVSPARPLYKIADISVLELRAYVSGDQLPHISIGQEVEVQIDANKKDNAQLKGEIIWIAEKAEFTPKTIQTKEERVNLVYAFKVRVQNPEGKIKIGMPGEIYFNHQAENLK